MVGLRAPRGARRRCSAVSRLRYIAAFVIGALAFTIVAPLLSTLMIIGLLLLITLLIVGAFIPGGGLLGFFAIRSVTGFLFYSRLGRTLLLALFFSLVSMLGERLGVPAYVSAPLLGGLLGLQLVWSPLGRLERTRPGVAGTPEAKRSGEVFIELGKRDLFLKEGITLSEFESGVLIVGTKARTVTRTLIKGLVEKGARVFAIGSSRLVPTGVRAEVLEVQAIDVSRDFEEFEDSPDNMIYALALAHRLKNDDVSNLIPAARLAREGLLGGKIARDELLQAIQVQDRRLGPLFASIAASARCTAPGGLQTSQLLSSEAEVVCVEPMGPANSRRDQVFMIAYLALMLTDSGRVLVIEDPEMVVADINLLSYESREPWERMYLALEYAKRTGLVLVSRPTPRTERVWSLCQTYILTSMSEPPARVSDRARQLLLKSRGLKEMEAIISGEGDRSFKIALTPPASVGVRRIEARAPVVRQVMVEVGGAESGEAVPEAPFKPTKLEEAFGDRVIDYANLLERCKLGLSPSPTDEAMLKELEKRGLVTSLASSYYITEAGEELLREYREAVRERGVIRRPEPKPEAKHEEQGERPAQTMIDSEEAAERMDEHMARLHMAESLFRQGKYGQCVKVSYEFMVGLIKAAFNIEKGHLDDLVGDLSRRGISVGLSVEEAKDAKTIVIEASNKTREGGAVPMRLALRMLSYARRLREALYERTRGGGSEGG